MSSTTQNKKPQTEEERVADWREEQFVQILKDSGVSEDEIDPSQILGLVESEVYPGELSDLIDSGCEWKLAIEILI